MLHLPNIFGGKSASSSPSPSPPPPVEFNENHGQQQPVGFWNDPSVPLAAHLSPSTPHAPGAFKEDDDSSKQLGYQDATSTAGGVQAHQSGPGTESATKGQGFFTNAADSQREDKVGTGKEVADENKSPRDGSNDSQPPPPRVGFYNNPSIPLASHLYSDNDQAAVSDKKEDDSKQLGHEGRSAAGEVESQPDREHEPQSSTKDKSALNLGLGSDSSKSDKEEPGIVKVISEDKTSIPFGEKEVDFSSPTHDPNETAANVKSSQSPPIDLTEDSTYFNIDSPNKKGLKAGIYSEESPIDQGQGQRQSPAQSQAQEMQVDPNADKSLAMNFGQMSMEERRVAEKQPLMGIEDEVNKVDLGRGDHQHQHQSTSTSTSPTARQLPTESAPSSSHPISNEEVKTKSASDARLDPGFGSAGRDQSAPRQIAGAEPLATSQTHHESHLDAKRAGIKPHHSAPSSTRGASTDESTAGERGSLDEDGKKKPKKKVGLGDKLAGAFEKLVGAASHNETKRLHGEVRQQEGKEAADALVPSHPGQAHSKGSKHESDTAQPLRHPQPGTTSMAPESERIHSNLHQATPASASTSNNAPTSGAADVLLSEPQEDGTQGASGMSGGNGAAEVGGVEAGTAHHEGEAASRVNRKLD